jgi:hypothetical protein
MKGQCERRPKERKRQYHHEDFASSHGNLSEKASDVRTHGHARRVINDSIATPQNGTGRARVNARA